jgi:D-glycerate 3-kinase
LRPDVSLWPNSQTWRVSPEDAGLKAGPLLERALEGLRIPESQWPHLAGASLGIAEWISRGFKGETLLIGINGAQGSGKSTTAELLAIGLQEAHGLRTIQFSIDDFYLTHAERLELAEKVHPLLATRGVPGTHDIALLEKTLASLIDAGPQSETAIPRFDKATDDRVPSSSWQHFRGAPQIIILEGWCVGSKAQPDELLAEAINSLEAEEDPDGTWRGYVNEQLKSSYHDLYRRFAHLIMLKIPDFGLVSEWRTLQETKLAQTRPASNESRIMAPSQLNRFIMHFERITRWNLQTLAYSADLTLVMDRSHRFTHAIWLSK